ncbi:hypothetical protein D515_02477 [Grimontia indica]|uniref:Uncharacterized protein n=1 Tax=Grimontia indica TaxID=1056512 RepID=R1ITP9_9GAMM|nr:hypothetical protein D515_02477 [Grimontia indica]
MIPVCWVSSSNSDMPDTLPYQSMIVSLVMVSDDVNLCSIKMGV